MNKYVRLGGSEMSDRVSSVVGDVRLGCVRCAGGGGTGPRPVAGLFGTCLASAGRRGRSSSLVVWVVP